MMPHKISWLNIKTMTGMILYLDTYHTVDVAFQYVYKCMVTEKWEQYLAGLYSQWQTIQTYI